MLLYFASALLQIIAYANILHIGSWFFWWSLFSLVAMGMYSLDLMVMQDSYPKFEKIPGGTKFLEKVEERHRYEMKYLVPAALIFNLVCVVAVLLFPVIFVNLYIYMIPGILQLAFTCYALYDCMQNFRVRSEMIEELYSEREKEQIKEAVKKTKKPQAVAGV
jgi:hypothetical protein